MTDAPGDNSAGPHTGYGTPNYRAFVLAMLVALYTFNFIDRVLIAIVQEPIKKEFGLSDTLLGLLGGPTFAILYTLLGIPIARLAERKNRTTILMIGVGLWSAATAVCGLASSYIMLLLARVGVSVGEASLTPSANSIIGDYFPADRRATAISIYSLGVPFGSALAAIGGGFIAQHLGWREAFYSLGLPGLILAVAFKLTVKEPPRQSEAHEMPDFVEALKAMASKPTFWHVSLGAAAAAFTGYGVGQFTNSFFIRTHHLEIFQASLITGTLVGVFGGLGTFVSGFLADRIGKKHPNALAWLPVLGFVVTTPLNMAAYMVASLPLAVGLLAVALTFQYLYLGSQYSITCAVVHPRMRATAVAVLLLVINMIGYGLGPLVLGMISDLINTSLMAPQGLTMAICKHAAGTIHEAACSASSATGLQYSIVIGFLGYLWAATHFMFAWKYMQRDWHR